MRHRHTRGLPFLPKSLVLSTHIALNLNMTQTIKHRKSKVEQKYANRRYGETKKELAASPYHRINSIISWGVDYTKSLNFRLRLNLFSYQETNVAPKIMILQNSLAKYVFTSHSTPPICFQSLFGKSKQFNNKSDITNHCSKMFILSMIETI